MKFAIQIHAAPNASSAGCTALRFARAALASGHEVLRVFFYQDGVYGALGESAAEWAALAREQPLDLVVCVAALERRGLQATVTASQGFRIGGLGLWMEAVLQADRVVVFGAPQCR